MLEHAIVGQEQDTFAVIIQPPDRVYTSLRDEVSQGSFSRFGRKLAHNIHRFVKQQIAKGQSGRLG